MAIRLDLASDQFNLAVLETGKGLRQRCIAGAQTLYFTPFKTNSGFDTLKELVLERRSLVRDPSPALRWNLFCHTDGMLSDEAIAATGFPGITYNQVAA